MAFLTAPAVLGTGAGGAPRLTSAFPRRGGPVATPPSPRRAAATLRASAGAPGQGSGSVSDSSPEEVRALLTSSDYVDRISALNRSRALGDERLAILLDLVQADPNAQVRYLAVAQLIDAGGADKAAVLPVVRAVMANDAETSVRAGAADVVCGLGLTEAYEDLVACYEANSDWMVKMSVVAGLGELGDGRAYEFLVDVLGAEDASGMGMLHTAAVGALGELGDKRGVDVVKGWMDSEDGMMRDRAADAYKQLTGEA